MPWIEIHDKVQFSPEKLVKSNAWKDILKQKGWDDAYMPADQFAKFLADEQTRVTAVMKTVGLVK